MISIILIKTNFKYRIGWPECIGVGVTATSRVEITERDGGSFLYFTRQVSLCQ